MKYHTDRADVKSRPRLTENELAALKLIAAGDTNVSIAAALGVSTSTTGRLLTSLFEKLGASDRTHATVIGLVSGLVKPVDVKVPTWVIVELSATREPLRVVDA